MNNETKPVETMVDGAGTSTGTVVASSTTQVDYEAVLAQKDAELAKVRDEKENYRKGMLIAKGKLPEENNLDNDSSETTEQMMRRIAREEALSTKEAQLQADKDDAYKAIIKRNKELEVALKNRGQIQNADEQTNNLSTIYLCSYTSPLPYEAKRV